MRVKNYVFFVVNWCVEFCSLDCNDIRVFILESVNFWGEWGEWMMERVDVKKKLLDIRFLGVDIFVLIKFYFINLGELGRFGGY